MSAKVHLSDSHVLQVEDSSAPFVAGRSKQLWMLEGGLCFVRLIESLSSFTYSRHEIVAGTGNARLDFYELAAARLAEDGVRCGFVRRVDDTGYIARYYKSLPVEVIVKNRAVGSTVRKYPGLFVEDEPLSRPVVKFDYRCDPEDQPIGEDYLRALGMPVEEMRRIALKVNESLRNWLSPSELWDFCLIFGLDGREEPHIISEISPDCMRLRSANGASLDKDLFRQGHAHTDITTVWNGLIEQLR